MMVLLNLKYKLYFFIYFMLKNKTKLNIFIFLIIILFIVSGCVFSESQQIKTKNDKQKIIQENNSRTKPQEQIGSSTTQQDLDRGDGKQLATSTEEIEYLDTSNWQTYRNEEYGFMVKYPKGWSEIIFNKTNNNISSTTFSLDNIWNFNIWQLNIGPQEKHGYGYCFNLDVYGFANISIDNYFLLVKELKSNKLNLILEEKNSGNILWVIYEPSGIGGSLNSLVYNKKSKQFFIFILPCNTNKNLLGNILSNFICYNNN